MKNIDIVDIHNFLEAHPEVFRICETEKDKKYFVAKVKNTNLKLRGWEEQGIKDIEFYKRVPQYYCKITFSEFFELLPIEAKKIIAFNLDLL